MTGRTHDLFAFTALNYILATQTIPTITIPTLIVALSANFVGGLAPDIDQPTADLYRRIRGGSFVARLISPLFGGHRFISHSILGIFLFGFTAQYILRLMNTFLIVDINIVWWAFMIGYISHLIIDSISKDGVPWLFPIPYKFGFPPIRALRIKTGEFAEKTLLFPGLIIINIYIYYHYSAKILAFLKNGIVAH